MPGMVIVPVVPVIATMPVVATVRHRGVVRVASRMAGVALAAENVRAAACEWRGAVTTRRPIQLASGAASLLRYAATIAVLRCALDCLVAAGVRAHTLRMVRVRRGAGR